MQDHTSHGSNSTPHSLLALFLTGGGRSASPEFEAYCRANPIHADALRNLMVEYDRRLRLVAGIVDSEERVGAVAEQLRERVGANVDPEIDLVDEAASGDPDSSSSAWERLREHSTARTPYLLQGQIAQGGMGHILRARDQTLRRSTAMKMIHPKYERVTDDGQITYEPRVLWRFLEEAQITGQLDHPGIVPVHELGIDGEGRVYFTMKLVKGRTLAAIYTAIFAGDGEWTETRVLTEVFPRVCDALAFAHAKGVVHRDLKPENVMVGDFNEVYVMDWGLARVSERPETHALASMDDRVDTDRGDQRQSAPGSPVLTQAGNLLGSPNYMPPEQARGDWDRVGPRSDVYAVGAMLYHLLARSAPYAFAGTDGAVVMDSVRRAPPTPLGELQKDLPPELVTICETAMARDPDARYAYVRELGDDLRAYLEHRVVERHAKGPIVQLRKWVARNRSTAASLGAALAAVLIGSIAFVWQVGSNQVLAEKSRSDKLAAERAIDSERLVAGARRNAAVGAWQDSLDSLQRAEEAGFDDQFELNMLRANAYLALGQSSEALDLLGAISIEQGTSSQRGRVRLLTAACENRPGSRIEAVWAHLQLALMEDLTSAQRAYTEGMLATNSVDSLNCLDESLELEPLDLLALHARLSMLFFLGRYDELRVHAELMVKLHPKDPSPWLALAMCEVAVNDKQAADQLLATPPFDANTRAALQTIVDLVYSFNQLPSTTFSGVSSSEKLADLKANLERVADRMPDLVYGETCSAMVPTMSSLVRPYDYLLTQAFSKGTSAREAVARMLSGLSTGGQLVAAPELAARELAFIVREHDEGFFHLLHGAALLTSALNGNEKQADKFRRTLSAFEKAMRSGSIASKTSHIARYLCCRLYSDLIARAGDTTIIPLARRTVHEMEVDALTDWEEASVVASVAVICQLESEALRIVDDWIELHPDDVGARASRCNVLVYLGANERALKEADELLAAYPLNERVVSAQLNAKATVEKAAKPR